MDSVTLLGGWKFLSDLERELVAVMLARDVVIIQEAKRIVADLFVADLYLTNKSRQGKVVEKP